MSPVDRLSADRYLERIAVDGDRLAEVAQRDLTADVPPCPGWTAADVVQHTGEVFRDKIACTLLGRFPGPDEYQQAPPDGVDLMDWYAEAQAELLELLDRLGPQAPSATWYPPDQTVGFWFRRMAQEVAVHRVDAESAAGVVTSVPDDIALDGIDEVLTIFVAWAVGADPDEDLAAFGSHSVVVRTGSESWRLVGLPDDAEQRLRVEPAAGPADLTITGEPSELFLWLWGRRPDRSVTINGDRDLVPVLRELLVRATQ